MNDVKKVILMCGKKDCCPAVTIGGNQVLIEDDFGGRVKLSKEQFELLKEKVKKEEL